MKEEILLTGVGRMGIEYARVLSCMNVGFIPVGRGEASARTFYEQTGILPITGGVKRFFDSAERLPSAAIVAVNVPDLYSVCRELLMSGIKRILVEKPGALYIEEIDSLLKLAMEKSASLFIAYNRRFLASVLEARRLLTEDGGVISFIFEFTEWSDRVEVFDADDLEKERWFLSNSSHVADLAFFVGGKPSELNSFTSGSLKWHNSAAAFCGSGITQKGVLFSYSANWDAPGRWGVELMSRNLRVILRPLEQLHVQRRGSVAIERLELDDSSDQKFKPGLFRMVEAFVGRNDENLCTISQQAELFREYCQIANYK